MLASHRYMYLCRSSYVSLCEMHIYVCLSIYVYMKYVSIYIYVNVNLHIYNIYIDYLYIPIRIYL